MLDLHTHILPKVDDGSQSRKQSMQMLRREARQGVKRVALTSHFYANEESPERFLKRRDSSLLALQAMAEGQKGLPEWIVGAEVAYFGGISRMEGIERLCLGTTRAILIEMPFCRWNRTMIDELVFLRESRGVQPILAHVDRYIKYQPLGMIRELRESGMWMQANASFFLRWQTSWLAMWMLKKHRIQFIGSDCHNTKRRPPNVKKAMVRIKERLGESAIRYLARMEKRLLEGE